MKDFAFRSFMDLIVRENECRHFGHGYLLDVGGLLEGEPKAVCYKAVGPSIWNWSRNVAGSATPALAWLEQAASSPFFNIQYDAKTGPAHPSPPSRRCGTNHPRSRPSWRTISPQYSLKARSPLDKNFADFSRGSGPPVVALQAKFNRLVGLPTVFVTDQGLDCRWRFVANET